MPCVTIQSTIGKHQTIAEFKNAYITHDGIWRKENFARIQMDEIRYVDFDVIWLFIWACFLSKKGEKYVLKLKLLWETTERLLGLSSLLLLSTLLEGSTLEKKLARTAWIQRHNWLCVSSLHSSWCCCEGVRKVFLAEFVPLNTSDLNTTMWMSLLIIHSPFLACCSIIMHHITKEKSIHPFCYVYV